MPLAVADSWVWDFWLIEHEGRYHAFFLKAPRALGDPELRHWNVSIGHAVSGDLRSWEYLPDALSPGPGGRWDDCSTWSGSVIEHDGVWYLFYTGTSRAEKGRIQRIGVATSPDLIAWTRVDGPILEADPRWYETMDLEEWREEAWRDPWVFRDPEDGMFHAYVTARARRGATMERGVVGHARSRDLVDWEVLPPLFQGSGFGELEIPQLVPFDGRWYLVFCSVVETQSAQRRKRGPGSGTYYVMGPGRFGPFTSEARHIQADPVGSHYGGRLVADGDRPMRYLAWERVTEAGEFGGRISDPLDVAVGEDGALSLVHGVDVRRGLK